MNKSSISKERRRELYLQIEPIAQKARESIIDCNSVIEDSFKLLEQQGFFIVGFPAKDDKLSGFHAEKSNIHFIYVNTAHDLGRQYFSMWHEYYHIYTGEKSDVSLLDNRDSDEIEYKAECFAGCILMPKNLVDRYLKINGIDVNWLSHANLIKMYTYFGVSYNAMLTRLIQLYPYCKKLHSLYGLSKPGRKDELIFKIRENGGNESLMHPTNRLYISPKFFENLQFNIENNRISNQKVDGIIEMLNCVEQGNDF